MGNNNYNTVRINSYPGFAIKTKDLVQDPVLKTYPSANTKLPAPKVKIREKV